MMVRVADLWTQDETRECRAEVVMEHQAEISEKMTGEQSLLRWVENLSW